jgi:lipid II:glycine glycyltransferase (peptidoglycan interpeptide bridge formation enzyme)
MKTCIGGYNHSVEIDQVTDKEWSDIINTFDDSIIYQTWPWGGVRWGKKNLSHIVLKKGAEVVAAAQCWIIKVPLFGWGIAYVKCGPMWRRNNTAGNCEEYKAIIRALKNEYAEKRGLLLRVMPNVVDGKSDEICSIFTGEGFMKCSSTAPYRTFVLDLTCSEEELKKGLSSQWRRKLKRSEQEPFQIIEDANAEAFDAFVDIYEETRNRKKFTDNLDVSDLRRINELLPDAYKVKIFISTIDESKMGGALVWPTGKTAILLLTGNTAKGLELHGSYFLTWHVINRMKAMGCRWLDLAGIDPEKYPGTYQFKRGLAGNLGKDITFDQFDYCKSLPSSLITMTMDHIRKLIKHPKKLLSLNNRNSGRNDDVPTDKDTAI